MKSLAISCILLSTLLVIDAGIVVRRRARNNAPLSGYGVSSGLTGQASALRPVTTSFGGSSFSGSSSSFSGSSSSFSGSASGPAAPVIAILSETNNAPGTLGDNSDFSNSFEAENGIRQQASGSTVVVGEDSVVVMKGSYEYIGDDGQTYVVDWIADENGFQPSAPHLPKDVPIPFPEIAAAVEAQIAFAAQEDAAGGSASSGNFQGQSSGFSGSSSFNSGFGGSQSFGASNQVQATAPLSNYGR